MENSAEGEHVEISYSIQTYFDPNGVNHEGERIMHRNGYTGYVDWNNTDLPLAGNNAARVMAVGGHLDFFVDETARNKGIGKVLFEGLVERVKDAGFGRLVILGATSGASGFYKNELNRLRGSGKVSGYSLTARDTGGGQQGLFI